jgi:hypothetical protein
MPQKVNLDALVQREDFEVQATSEPASPIQTVSIRDLKILFTVA